MVEQFLILWNCWTEFERFFDFDSFSDFDSKDIIILPWHFSLYHAAMFALIRVTMVQYLECWSHSCLILSNLPGTQGTAEKCWRLNFAGRFCSIIMKWIKFDHIFHLTPYPVYIQKSWRQDVQSNTKVSRLNCPMFIRRKGVPSYTTDSIQSQPSDQ